MSIFRTDRIKTVFRYIIPLIVSVGLCYVLYADIQWRDLVAIFRTCRIEWLLGSLMLSVTAQVVRAFRWRLQLSGLGIRVSVHEMLCSIFGTYAVNLVFPRLGEVWRTGYVAERGQAPFTVVFGSMVADRVSDTIAVGLMAVLAAVVASGAMHGFVVSTGVGERLAAVMLSPWMAVAVAFMVVIAVIGLRNRRVAWIARVVKILCNVWHGFMSVRSMPRKWLFVVFTAVIWGAYFIEMWISFYAFPDTEAVIASHGLKAAFVTFIFGSVAMAVPSNGGIGPWQAAVVLALSGIYGLPAATALAFATIVLAAQTLLTIVLGLYTFIVIALARKPGGRPVELH